MRHSRGVYLTIAGLLIVAIVLIGILLRSVLISGARAEADAVQTMEEQDWTGAALSEKWAEGDILYGGKTYRYNTSVKAYLFLGIDKNGTVVEERDGQEGGQSDAIFLLVEDTKEKTLTILAIHRNTMTEIDIYDVEGHYLGSEMRQICLQHGYGEGTRSSCQRTVQAVSRLLYNIPISGYFSMNMGGIPLLNDAIGGVEITLGTDMTLAGEAYEAGTTLLLNGRQAYDFLHYRDITAYDSATARLERQMEYLPAMIAKIAELSADDQKAGLRVYRTIEDYVVTNLDFAKQMDELSGYDLSDVRMEAVRGETVLGTVWEEYYVDEDALYDLIIRTFYVEVEG